MQRAHWEDQEIRLASDTSLGRVIIMIIIINRSLVVGGKVLLIRYLHVDILENRPADSNYLPSWMSMRCQIIACDDSTGNIYAMLNLLNILPNIE